ncbi:MAG: TIGR00270 family protein [Nanoarchaeota archaeon]|nr:TIGR00270 family protein [Nanoarchaeota archaeon]MBU4124232.1 TIGR00270 family protein [Nanoarchaeota archaeon]
MECCICGKKAVTRANVDGVVLDVCSDCVKFGKAAPKVIMPNKQKQSFLPEMEISIKFDISKIVKSEREKMNLTREQLGIKLGEKESVIRKIEEGWMPPFNTVNKLEKFFKVTLKETTPDIKIKKHVKEELTIGDMLKIED